jgi:predicted DNA-binding protein
MIRSVKKLKKLADSLNKDNNILISEAIELLREEQPFEGAIGLLTSFYNKTDDHLKKKAIEGFMNDLKDQAASVEVINEIIKIIEESPPSPVNEKTALTLELITILGK